MQRPAALAAHRRAGVGDEVGEVDQPVPDGGVEVRRLREQMGEEGGGGLRQLASQLRLPPCEAERAARH